MSILRLKSPAGRVGAYSLNTLKAYQPTLLLWGGGIAGAVGLFASSIPLFKHDVLDKIPIVRSYFADKTPDSDKPF